MILLNSSAVQHIIKIPEAAAAKGKAAFQITEDATHTLDTPKYTFTPPISTC